jgi:hypothetical protein
VIAGSNRSTAKKPRVGYFASTRRLKIEDAAKE